MKKKNNFLEVLYLKTLKYTYLIYMLIIVVISVFQMGWFGTFWFGVIVGIYLAIVFVWEQIEKQIKKRKKIKSKED